MNPFDLLQSTAFNVVTNTMGYDATWMRSEVLTGDVTFTARVLLNNPTEDRKVLKTDFDPLTHRMEYKQGDFPGLFEMVQKGREEVVTVNGQQYGIIHVTAKYDGKTYIAELQKL